MRNAGLQLPGVAVEAPRALFEGLYWNGGKLSGKFICTVKVRR